MSNQRLLSIVAFQVEVIQFAEGVIESLGETPRYRRLLYAHLAGNAEAHHPADMMQAARIAAECHGLPPREIEPTPLDDYLGGNA